MVSTARIAILQARARPTWSTRRLRDALRARGHRVAIVPIDEVTVLAEDGRLQAYVDSTPFEPDAVVVRSLGVTATLEMFLKRLDVLAHLEAMGVVVINPWFSNLIARDKYLTILYLMKSGVPIPPTMLTEQLGAVVSHARRWSTVVLKPLVGSLGLGAFKAENVDVAYHIASLLLGHSKPVYMQKYVRKVGECDIRVFVVGEDVVAAVRRCAPPGGWKTNIAQGARAEPVKLSQTEKEVALKAVKALGMYYAGVDLAVDDEGKLYVFEVNAMPNWRGLYRATGIDPAQHIAELIDRLVKRGDEE